MTPAIRQRIIRILLLTAPVMLLAALLLHQMSAPTAIAQGPESDKDSQRRAEYMQQVAADGQPTAGLEALSAIPCVDGFAGEYPCENADLASFLPTTDIGGGAGTGLNDIWGWTDPVTGNEYALVGRTDGTAFVDITDPENPIYIGDLNTRGSPSTWRDIKVHLDHAFIVADLNGAHGMQVFDLNQLRDAIPPVEFDETAHYDEIGSAHNIAINEETGYAYIIGASACNGGLHMVDISDPVNPTFAGCFSEDGYTHDVQCVVYSGPDPDHQGSEVCFAANEDTLTIVDVTDKSAPLMLSRTPYAGSGYTHQGWLTDDQVHFLLDDELDELNNGHNTRTYIWDVSDLDAAAVIGNFDSPTPATDHNQYIHEGISWQSNYASGLRILDISDIANANLEQLGYFDVYPEHNDAGFDGTWSNYPYFESGMVIVTGRDRGLFVVDPVLVPDFTLQTEDDELAVCNDDSDSTTIDLLSQLGYTGSVTLSTEGLPAGASSDFNPNPVSVPGSSDLTVTTSGTDAGTYPFTVLGTDGTLTHDLPLTLDVYDGAPDAPALLSPPDGATGIGTRPTFEWSAAEGTASYTFELASDPDFTDIIESASGIEGLEYQ
ncbi:MAG: choice-of-anchor B family protein, partial [Ardenticatenaceae bacterium]